MRRHLSSVLPALTLLLVGATDLSAQVVPELLGNWGGRMRSRTEAVLDPADTGGRGGSQPSTRNDQFWVLGFEDTGGQMVGLQRYVDWNVKNQVMTRDAIVYPIRVTEVDGKEFKVEWGQGTLACEANVELKDDDTKLDGRFVCRERSNTRTVLEMVTRGNIDFERYVPEAEGGGR